MRLWVLGMLGLASVGLASPTAWHTLEPPPPASGWYNSPVLVTLYASGGTGLVVKYRINGGGVSTQPPPATIHLSSEGIHTIEYWAEDDTGESSHAFFTVRIDLSPPRIHVRIPEEHKKYLLHEKVLVDWFAYDRLSGLEFVEASAQPGEPLDTMNPGYQTFFVFARDRAGNTARLEVDYQVICKISPVFPTGFWLDKLLPPEEQVRVGLLSVLARYKVGEPILFGFLLRDVNDFPFIHARPNVLITQVRFTEEGERHTIWDWVLIPYNSEKGFYFLAYPTEKREPGIYDLWLGFGDGQSTRIRVEILAKE